MLLRSHWILGLFVSALAFAGGRADAQSCPLVVDPGGSGHFTSIQAALDHFRTSLGNLGPCTITVAPGVYTSSVGLDGVNTGATSDAQRLVLKGTRGSGGSYLRTPGAATRSASSARAT